MTIRFAVSGLSCELGGNTVLDNVGFDIAAGALMAIRGANGAGKSTLLRILAGLQAFDAGDIHLWLSPDEEPVNTAGRMAVTHYQAHQDAQKPSLTVAQNLRFWASYLGDGVTDEIMDEALTRVDILRLKDMPARTLSAGQRRRLAIARLLTVKRPVWLLDEPTAALDKQSEGLLGEIVAGHLAEGGLVIAATHSDLPVKVNAVLTLGEAPKAGDGR